MSSVRPCPAPRAATIPRPEVELLLCCARTCMDAERAEQLSVLLQHNIDWGYLLQTAARHGVTPLVYWNLHTTAPGAVPETILAQLQHLFYANVQRNFFLTNQLLTLLKLFETHHIPAIPYKGPVLASVAYGNIALRCFGDLDILIHAQDYPRVKEFLVARGYEPSRDMESSSWAVHFFHDTTQVSLDIHWNITPQTPHKGSLSFSPVLEQVWKRAMPIAIVGNTVLHFAPEDTLIIRCQDAIKDYYHDGWPRLLSMCDVAGLTQVLQGADWEELMERARQCGSQRAVLLCLALARNLLGTTLPDPVYKLLQRSRQVQHLTCEVCQRFFREADAPNLFLEGWGAVLRRNLFCIKVKEYLFDRVPYIFNIMRFYTRLLAPNEKDRALCHLPGALFPLYYLLRLIRLMWEYGPESTKKLVTQFASVCRRSK